MGENDHARVRRQAAEEAGDERGALSSRQRSHPSGSVGGRKYGGTQTSSPGIRSDSRGHDGDHPIESPASECQANQHHFASADVAIVRGKHEWCCDRHAAMPTYPHRQRTAVVAVIAGAVAESCRYGDRRQLKRVIISILGKPDGRALHSA